MVQKDKLVVTDQCGGWSGNGTWRWGRIVNLMWTVKMDVNQQDGFNVKLAGHSLCRPSYIQAGAGVWSRGLKFIFPADGFNVKLVDHSLSSNIHSGWGRKTEPGPEALDLYFLYSVLVWVGFCSFSGRIIIITCWFACFLSTYLIWLNCFFEVFLSYSKVHSWEKKFTGGMKLRYFIIL